MPIEPSQGDPVSSGDAEKLSEAPSRSRNASGQFSPTLAGPRRPSGPRKPATVTAAWIAGACAIAVAIVAGTFSLLNNGSVIPTQPSKRHIIENDSGARSLVGNWYGYFREFDPQGIQVITEEDFEFRFEDEDLVGNFETRQHVQRKRSFLAHYRFGHLTVDYFAQDGPRMGAAVYLLQGKPTDGTFKGYWLGTDPEQNRLVCGPYILTRESHKDRVLREYSAWLDQPLYFNKKEN